MREWIPGQVVRYWSGDDYRIGTYLRTVERGRHKNKRIILVRRWSAEKGWHDAKVRIRPDHVTRLEN